MMLLNSEGTHKRKLYVTHEGIWYSCPIAEKAATYYINTLALNQTFIVITYFLSISHIIILPFHVSI
jgi:hypothetical protein